MLQIINSVKHTGEDNSTEIVLRRKMGAFLLFILLVGGFILLIAISNIPFYIGNPANAVWKIENQPGTLTYIFRAIPVCVNVILIYSWMHRIKLKSTMSYGSHAQERSGVFPSTERESSQVEAVDSRLMKLSIL